MIDPFMVIAAAAQMRGTNLVVLATILSLDVDELDGTGRHLYIEDLGTAYRYLSFPVDLLIAGLDG
jgi:hypothetical protein